MRCETCIHKAVCKNKEDYKNYLDKVNGAISVNDRFDVFINCKDYCVDQFERTKTACRERGIDFYGTSLTGCTTANNG